MYNPYDDNAALNDAKQQAATNARHIFSVSELNHCARELLETRFRHISLEGEISNLAQPNSGHIYLTLKDDASQLRCAMFKGRNRTLTFKPQNGNKVLVTGKLSLYAPRGDYQLIIDSMEEAGLGALQRAYEALKTKLFAEGLFDEAQKQPIPAHPKSIGVVTSATGAAIHDIISVIRRRFPLLPITIYPCLVQGANAAETIIKGIEQANRRQECDVLIVGRGGGSLEDLWAFNDERLARVIAASELPIISAVGHQVDFTIADFVADVRAPTPSAAAELVSPDQGALKEQFEAYEFKLLNQWQLHLQRRQQYVDRLSLRIEHPSKKLAQQQQLVSALEKRLAWHIQHILSNKRQQQTHLENRLLPHNPSRVIPRQRQQVQTLEQRLYEAIRRQRASAEQSLSFAAQQLHAISPLATLGRGYSILKDNDNRVVHRIEGISPGDTLTARVEDGIITTTVNSTESVKNDP